MARGLRKPTAIRPLTHVHRQPGAWYVAIQRKGRAFTDYFSDAVYGGRQRSLVAAQRFRDDLLLRIGPDTRVRRRPVLGRGSATGIVGVSLERTRVHGRVYESYTATWPDPEKGQARRRFLIQRYGRERALALAQEAREAGIAQNHARMLALQREQASQRLRQAPPMPRKVRDPLTRKGISMASRRPRRAIGRGRKRGA